MKKARKEGTLPVSWYTLAQTLYISARLFGQNALFIVGQACAFGLFFSLFPVLFLVLSIVLHLLHGYIPVVEGLYSYVSTFLSWEQYSSTVNAVMSVNTIGLPEIIAGIVIFWFARRLFLSLMRGYGNIFHTQAQRTYISFSMWGFAGEALFIILCIILLVALITVRSLAGVIHITHLLPEVAVWFESWLYPLIINLIPRFLLCLLIMWSYRYAPGTKPSTKLCFWSAVTTSVVFWIFQLFFGLFVDLSRYNLVYGVVANVIVIMLEIVTFFNIYFFMVQYIFVYQFFKELLIAELYLLSDADTHGKINELRRKLFQYDKWLTTIKQAVEVPARQEVFLNGEEDSSCVYYIARGTVVLESSNGIRTEQEKGSFFGEVSAILERPREMTVIAKDDVTLIRIERSMFVRILESDPLVTRKLLSKMSNAFDNV